MQFENFFWPNRRRSRNYGDVLDRNQTTILQGNLGVCKHDFEEGLEEADTERVSLKTAKSRLGFRRAQ